MDADREGRWANTSGSYRLLDDKSLIHDFYKEYYKGKVEQEIADAVIRLCDLAGLYNIDLDWHVRAKMAYNETRPRLRRRKVLIRSKK